MTRDAMPSAVRLRTGPVLGADRPPLFAPQTQTYRVSRGRHHALVSLQLKLGLRRSCALVVLECIGFILLTAAVLLLARQGLSLWAGNKSLDTEQHKLLLATHNRIAWYYPYQDAMKVLHEGEGVHYGMFPGDPQPGHPRTVWNVIRPHNWRPATKKEHMVLLDADTGAELNRVEIPSRFTHDAIRVGDHVYVCSTGNGTILELSYPDMTLVRSMPLFSDKDHPNTLAAVIGDPDHIWVLLHNLGESDLVKVFIGQGSPPHEASRISGVGTKAHGVVAWGSDLIMLDSDNGVLVSLDTETGDVFDLWMVPEEGKFLKGLAVLDDIAYFGITTWAERSVRDSPDSNGELAAFDLAYNQFLWRRTVPTAGLLNIIGAPHLATDSTYAATYSHTKTADLIRSQVMQIAPPASTVVMPDSEAVVQQAVDVLRAAGYPPVPIDPTDYWSSGWPRMNPEPKLTESPEDAGLQLPLFHANISALQAKVLDLPDAAWTREYQAVHNAIMTGRTQNMDKFKPGVEGIVLIFSDNEGNNVYEFPYYRLLKDELEPLLLEILGPADLYNVVRLQLARMAPGTSDIKTHQDMGGYAMHGHRIHVPLTTHPLVSFSQCPDGDGNAAALVQRLAAAAAAESAVDSSHDSLRRLAAAEQLQHPTAAATEVPSLSVEAETETEAPSKQGAQQRMRRRLQQQRPTEPEPPRFKVQQQWVAQQEQAQASTAEQLPRPLEPLPVDAVGGYYIEYQGIQEAEERAGVAYQRHPQQAPAPGVPTPREPKPVDPRDVYYLGDAVQGAGQLHVSQPRPHAVQQQQQQLQDLHTKPLQQQQAAEPSTQQHNAHKNHRLQQKRRQLERLKQRRQRPCMKLYTPEGLVFELNNRVPHKVSNPAASHTTRIHLVIDVFESSRARTPVPAGSSCEYGSMPMGALRHLQDMLEQNANIDTVTEEIRAIVASPGISCVDADGNRIMPLRKHNTRMSAAEAAQLEGEEELVQQLLAQLQAVVAEKHRDVASAAVNFRY